LLIVLIKTEPDVKRETQSPSSGDLGDLGDLGGLLGACTDGRGIVGRS